jgi:hypothetical protein
MDRRRSIFLALALLLAAAVAAETASALRIVAGNIVITGNGGFAPKSLPKYFDAPIKLYGRGKVATRDGSLPPIVETIMIEYDRHGHVETTGLQVCRAADLEATTVTQARRNCGGAVVGKGFGKAIIKFPEQRPIPVTSPITIFNGPRKQGDPTVFAHAHITIPVPTAFVVPITIETIDKGRYGYRTTATIPPIAGGAGVPISGRLKVERYWSHKDREHSYVNARCTDGRLQARVEVGFKDGTLLSGTVFKRCTVRTLARKPPRKVQARQ